MSRTTRPCRTGTSSSANWTLCVMATRSFAHPAGFRLLPRQRRSYGGWGRALSSSPSRMGSSSFLGKQWASQAPSAQSKPAPCKPPPNSSPQARLKSKTRIKASTSRCRVTASSCFSSRPPSLATRSGSSWTKTALDHSWGQGLPINGVEPSRVVEFGGDKGARTPGLFHAMEALSQLSYIPTHRKPLY